MSDDKQTLELIQAARCEDLVDTQISSLTVVGDFERKVIDTIKGAIHYIKERRSIIIKNAAEEFISG